MSKELWHSNRFTYFEYEVILQYLKENFYWVGGYHEDIPPRQQNVCVIRHDVDLDLSRIKRMAVMEHKYNIRTTYCLMVRSKAYNLFSEEGREALGWIRGNGHFLGLHFDCDYYGGRNATMDTLARGIKDEAALLCKNFGADGEVDLISFHKPNALVLSGDIKITGGIAHAYAPLFMEKMFYRSDSFGFWSHGHPYELIGDKRPLNLSIHPIWWNEKYQSSLYSLTSAMENKKQTFREYMLTQIVGV